MYLLVAEFTNVGKHKAPDLNINAEDWQTAVDDITAYVDTFPGCENLNTTLDVASGKGQIDQGRGGLFTVRIVKEFNPYPEESAP